MPATSSSATEGARRGARTVALGLAAIVLILTATGVLLFLNLPSAGAFNARIERIFVEHPLTAPAELRLLEILALSGEAFSETLRSYRVVIFVLLVFATALLVTALAILVMLGTLNRRLGEIERAGIEVRTLEIDRTHRRIRLNDLEFDLTEAVTETLAVLAEARMDGDILSGAQIEALVSGRTAADCDEAAGATRIKRLRDALGNALVSELLVRNIARQGYVLAIDRRAIRLI